MMVKSSLKILRCISKIRLGNHHNILVESSILVKLENYMYVLNTRSHNKAESFEINWTKPRKKFHYKYYTAQQKNMVLLSKKFFLVKDL